MHNDLYPEMVIGCLKARTVPVNVNHHYTPREVAELLDYVKPRAVIYHQSLGAKFADVLPASLRGTCDLGRRRHRRPGIAGTVQAGRRSGTGRSDQAIAASPDDLIMYAPAAPRAAQGRAVAAADTYVSSMVGADHESAVGVSTTKVRRWRTPWFAVSP